MSNFVCLQAMSNVSLLTIPERGVARVAWSILEFYTPLIFSGMAEDIIVKFYARIGPRGISLVMTNWLPNWAWSRSDDVLIF